MRKLVVPNAFFEAAAEILKEGKPVRLIYSDALREAAEAEAKALDQTFDEFKADLLARLGKKPN